MAKKHALGKCLTKHNCQDYCAICSPVHALEVIYHRAIIKRKKIFTVVKMNDKAMGRQRKERR